MTARSIEPRLLDIIENIRIVGDAIAGRDYQSFAEDRVLRLAVERAIEIISEATRHIPGQQRASFPDIPWRNIMAIGNKLRHEYQRIDPDIIWDIATNHLHGLLTATEKIRISVAGADPKHG